MQLNVEIAFIKLTISVYLKRLFSFEKTEANDNSSRIKRRTNTPPSMHGIVQLIAAGLL